MSWLFLWLRIKRGLANNLRMKVLAMLPAELIALEDRYGAHNYAPLDVVIERAGKPAVRLAVTEAPDQPAPKGKRIPGQYAGQVNYPDELWKALETDEELREYGFDIMIDDGKPDDLAM